MQVSQVGVDAEDHWRRQLIDRLADVQVALWASEADHHDDAGPSPGSQTAVPELHADAATVFLGLAADASGGEGARAEQRGYETWDRIDTNRELMDLAQKFASKSSMRARRGGLLFNAGCVATVCLLGLTGTALLQNGDQRANANSAGYVPAATLSLLTTVDRPKEPVDRPVRPAGEPSHERTIATANRSAAGDHIATLLAETRQEDVVEDRFREFVEGRRSGHLLPVVGLQVSETGRTPFPFTLAAGAIDLTGASVLLAGVPPGVSPLKGSNLTHGTWQFKLSDLSHQEFQVDASVQDRFDLHFGVIRQDGTIINQGHLHIELRRGSVTSTDNATAVNNVAAEQAIQTTATDAGRGRVARRPRGRAVNEASSKPHAVKAQVRKVRPPASDLTAPMALGGDTGTTRSTHRSETNEAASQWNLELKPQAHPKWSPFSHDRSP